MDDRIAIEARVRLFIDDHAEWERDFTKRETIEGDDLPCPCDLMGRDDILDTLGAYHDRSKGRWEDGRRDLEALARKHCTHPDVLTKRGFGVCSSLQHDPEAEHIGPVRIVGDQATVETEVVAGFCAGYEYRLLRRGGTWLIDRITSFHSRNEPADPPLWDETACARILDLGDSCGIDFLAAFASGGCAYNAESNREETLSLVQLGVVALPSALMVVTDPGTFGDPVLPLGVKASKASCLVEVVRAGRQNAFVRVVFGAWSTVVEFVPAQLLGMDTPHVPTSRGGHLLIGDAATWAATTERARERFYFDLVERPHQRGAEKAWIEAIPGSDRTAALIGRGGGDYDCPCYWAIDKAGRPQALVVDLGICERSIERSFVIPVTEALLHSHGPHAQLAEFNVEARFERCGDSIVAYTQAGVSCSYDLLGSSGEVLSSTDRAGSSSCGGVSEQTMPDVPGDLRGTRIRARWHERRHVFAREIGGF